MSKERGGMVAGSLRLQRASENRNKKPGDRSWCSHASKPHGNAARQERIPMSTNERDASTDLKHYGDNFIPVIPSDYLEHDPNNSFCWNDGCICREDQDAIGTLNEAY